MNIIEKIVSAWHFFFKNRENVVKCFRGIPENVVTEGWRNQD